MIGNLWDKREELLSVRFTEMTHLPVWMTERLKLSAEEEEKGRKSANCTHNSDHKKSKFG